MEIRKILFRKEMKLVTLLLTAMLIASASAAVYYSMNMQSTATIGAAAVYFTAGDDSGGGVFTPGANNTYAALVLSAYPNVTLTYDQAVNLTATADKQVQLSPVSISPDDGDPSVGNFTSVVFTLINGTGAVKGTLTYTTSGDDWTEPGSGTGYTAITSGEVWTVKIEIMAAPGAYDGISTTILIAVDVQ